MNKFLAGLCVLAVLLGGYAAFKVSGIEGRLLPESSFGATEVNTSTVTYSSALNNEQLYNRLRAIVTDLDAVRDPLQNLSSTTVTLNFLNINATSSQSTSTAFTGVTGGDFIIITPSSTSAAVQDVHFSATPCGADTVCIHAVLATSTSVDVNLGAETFRLRLLPQATFARPSSLLLVSTSTPQN